MSSGPEYHIGLHLCYPLLPNSILVAGLAPLLLHADSPGIAPVDAMPRSTLTPVCKATTQLPLILHRHPLPIPNPPTTPYPSVAPNPTSLLFFTVPCALTPLTTLSNPVSTTTPPTIISPSVACSVSKLKIRSNSQTFSNRRSRASTKTWIRSSRARGIRWTWISG